jgi:hypothetical protein
VLFVYRNWKRAVTLCVICLQKLKKGRHSLYYLSTETEKGLSLFVLFVYRNWKRAVTLCIICLQKLKKGRHSLYYLSTGTEKVRHSLYYLSKGTEKGPLPSVLFVCKWLDPDGFSFPVYVNLIKCTCLSSRNMDISCRSSVLKCWEKRASWKGNSTYRQNLDIYQKSIYTI